MCIYIYIYHFYISYSHIVCTVPYHIHHGVTHQNIRRRHAAARSCACGDLCEENVFANVFLKVLLRRICEHVYDGCYEGWCI